jgi:class 3 adenylate cyclase/tetratricopeptide (TPR) repeat protein
MECPACGAENPAANRFCGGCGSALAAVCAGCGQRNPPSNRFCGECGASLAVTAPSPRPVQESPAITPRSYTPQHLTDKILTSRSALEGERKQVTVLFVDVVESTRLAERLDPEVMHQVMDRALRLMAEAVHRYDGTVNQFLGDGLMALFGAPVALEDHAFRAVQAALAVLETIGGYSVQLSRDRGVQLRLRLGLNSGLVVVGKIGDDLRMDYTAVGDTTNLAARMQALAEPGAILVTEATHRLIEGHVRSEALGPVQVKGFSEPVSVYKVIGRRRRRTRLEVSAERSVTELVGRGRELGVLHDCLARAEAGRGQVVGIVGEPGVGKSRLVYEFRHSLEGGRITWLEGHCVAYGQATPYLPHLEILGANFQIEEGDNPLQTEEKLRLGVRLLELDPERILPFLRELFALPSRSDDLQHLEPKDKRRKTFEALRALAVAGAQRRPLVLVLEDLHWIDRTSEDYCAFLVESIAGLPILLLATHRPGYAVRWADKTYYTQLALDQLTEREAEEMVARLLHARDLPPDLLRVIGEKAEGNPLFVEEITRSLLERGLLVRNDGGVAWAGRAAVELPGTIHDIIAARLDRLDEPVKRTAQAAAVIGREFGLGLLTRISERAAEVSCELDTLKQLELIHETRFYPELEFIFKHAVIQDVAYQSLLLQRRKELHGAIGNAVEELYADRLDEQAAILAYHYARSERQDRAVHYALLAGDQAARLYANAEARTYYEQALSIARTLPSSPEAQRAEIDAALKLATVGVTRQDLERDRTNLDVACELAEQLQDRPRLAQVLYWLGRNRYVLGEPRTAVGYATRSLEVAETVGDDALAAPPVNLLGRSYHMLGELARAAALIERSVAQMQRLGNKAEEATAATFAGYTFAYLGEFEAASRYAERGLRLAQEIQNPFAEGAAHFGRGVVHVLRGDWDQAIAALEHASRVAEQAGDLFRVYIAKAWGGWALTGAGDLGRGRALLEDARALAARLGTSFQLAHFEAKLAACLVAFGEAEAARGLCHEAIRVAEKTDDPFGEALAQRALAEAIALGGLTNRAAAERSTLEAIRIQQQIGSRPELGRSYLSYARLLQGWGELDRAREVLGQAIALFRETGMAQDLARAEQLAGELTVSQ